MLSGLSAQKKKELLSCETKFLVFLFFCSHPKCASLSYFHIFGTYLNYFRRKEEKYFVENNSTARGNESDARGGSENATLET